LVMLVALAMLLAIWTDLRWGKIYNLLTLPLLAILLAWVWWHGGWVGLGQGLVAGLFTVAMLAPRAGGGDLKLSASVAVLLGWPACTAFVAAVYLIRWGVVLAVRLWQTGGSVRRLWTLLHGEAAHVTAPLRYPGAPVIALAALVAGWLEWTLRG